MSTPFCCLRCILLPVSGEKKLIRSLKFLGQVRNALL